MTTRLRRRITRLLLLSLFAGSLVATGAALPAQAADTASISGTVLGAGSPTTVIIGAHVDLFLATKGSVPFRSTETNASGVFSFTSLPAGNYSYAVSTENYRQYGYLSYYPGVTDFELADFFSVGAGQAVTGRGMTIPRQASVSGVVSNSSSVGIAGVEVTATELTTPPRNRGSATTDSAGNYVLLGLTPGTYTLSFNYTYADGAALNYGWEWWNDATTAASATSFTLSAGQAITGRNAQLATSSHISGNVKGPGNANLFGATVTAYEATTGDYAASTTTNASGNYTLNHLAGGSYKVQFTHYSTEYAGNAASEWFNDQTTKAAATPIAVGTGATVTGKDAVLAAPVATASVSGNVKGLSNANLSGIQVYLVDNVDASTYGSAVTNASGNYTIYTVPAGTYTLEFYDPAGTYPREYWNNKKSWSTADVFTVAAGTAVTGRNAVLDYGGTIQGTAKYGSGTSLAYAGVVAYVASGGETLGAVAGSTVANPYGDYQIKNLPPGTYKIGFSSSASGYSAGTYGTGRLLQPKTFTSTWYGDSYTFAGASTVTITTDGQVVSSIGATLPYPTFGDVTDPSSTFYTAIEWMYTSNISTGTPTLGKPLYKPGDSVSRQAMASFLYKLSGDTFTPPGTASFADVAVGSTFFTAIEWMKAQGISTGTPQPSGLPLFKPADVVSRQAMATFLSRYAGATTPTPTTQSFADVPLSASTAGAIEWMKSTGISTGTPQPSGLPLYKPADPVSRQAMALFLYRLAHLP